MGRFDSSKRQSMHLSETKNWIFSSFLMSSMRVRDPENIALNLLELVWTRL